MMRRASSKQYSQVSTTAGEEEEQSDIPVVVEPVVAHAVDMLSEVCVEQGLTWTDDFFQRDADIVAVFDYDLEQIKQMKFDDMIAPFFGFGLMASFGGFVWSLMAGMPVWVTLGFALIFIVLFASLGAMKRHFEETVGMASAWPQQHTAITRTGLRYVQPSAPSQQGFALEIPFQDILEIKIAQHPNTTGVVVWLTLASTDDGLEYVTSGFHAFQHHGAHVYLRLLGLKEPVRFKKVTMKMKDKLSPPLNGGAKLLSRVEAILDSDHSSDPDVRRALTELVVEMRAFNKSSSVSVQKQQQEQNFGAIV